MEDLSNALRAYADGFESRNVAQFYMDLADAFLDEDFLELFRAIDNSDEIDKVLGRFAQQKQISEYNIREYSTYFYDIHTTYISYRLDRHKAGIGKLRQHIREIDNQISLAEDNIKEIEKISGVLSGTEMLEAYAKDFGREAQEHEKKARNWLGWLIVSAIGLAAIVIMLLCVPLYDLALLKELTSGTTDSAMYISRFAALAIKGGILTAYAQLPLFLRKNYYAERHLEQANIHRRNVLKSLHAVYSVVSDEKERDKLLTIGATVAFSEPESGFITRKEGAGSDSFNIESIIKSLSK